jgi:hypothetical protein
VDEMIRPTNLGRTVFATITIFIVVVVMVATAQIAYRAGYEDAEAEIPPLRIDQTEAYDLGWKEARSIHSFIPVPSDWVVGGRHETFDNLKVIGILTEDPSGGCIAWKCTKKEGNILKFHSYAADEVPPGYLYYIATWAYVNNPFEKEDEDIPER